MIQKLNWFKKQPLEGKRKLVLGVGASPENAPDVEICLANNFKEDRASYEVFYLQGGLDYEKMGFIDKKLMHMLCKMIAKKEGIDSERYRGISQSFDQTSKEKLQPLLSIMTQSKVDKQEG